MESILLTGVGMVGAQLMRKLAADHGVRPVALDLAPHRAFLDTILDPSSYDLIEGSILDRPLVERVLREHGITRIVHTAAVLPMRVGHDAHPGFYQVNTWGTANLMFAAAACGVKRFVMFSTNGVYQFRQHPVNGPVAEDFPSGLSPHNSYGNSKAAAEYLLRELTSEGRLDGKIVRPGEIYGPVMTRPGDDPIYWKAMFDAAIDGRPYVLEGHPEHRLDWAYSKDVAELALRVLMAPTTPHVEYHAAYGRCMGIYDLKAALDAAFPGNRVTLNACAKGGWNHPLSGQRARADLDFTPAYDLTAGLADYVEWYRRVSQTG